MKLCGPAKSYHFRKADLAKSRFAQDLNCQQILFVPILRFPSRSALFIFLHFGFFPFRSLLVTPVSLAFPLRFLQFSSPCFASPAYIASSASSGMMLAVLGVLSSIRQPPKTLVFGRRGEMRQTTLKPNHKSFAPYKGGQGRAQRKTYAHSRRHGAHGLILESKPSGLGLRPDHVRWPDLRAHA